MASRKPSASERATDTAPGTSSCHSAAHTCRKQLLNAESFQNGGFLCLNRTTLRVLEGKLIPGDGLNPRDTNLKGWRGGWGVLVPAHPARPEPSVWKVRKKAENPWRKRDAEGPLGGKAQRQFCVLSFQHRGRLGPRLREAHDCVGASGWLDLPPGVRPLCQQELVAARSKRRPAQPEAGPIQCLGRQRDCPRTCSHRGHHAALPESEGHRGTEATTPVLCLQSLVRTLGARGHAANQEGGREDGQAGRRDCAIRNPVKSLRTGPYRNPRAGPRGWREERPGQAIQDPGDRHMTSLHLTASWSPLTQTTVTFFSVCFYF